jgi:hypothetical protein
MSCGQVVSVAKRGWYNTSMPKKTEEAFMPVLKEIDVTLRRQNSFVFIFLHGFVRGMGTALGATILVGVVTSLTLHFAGTPSTDAVMKSIVGSLFE